MGGSCPAPVIGHDAPPYRELPPFVPVTLKPDGRASVVLHFRGELCGGAPPKASEIDNSFLRVEYEVDGHSETQLLRTGGARLLVAGSCGPAERP
jgi:hypothetical protein